MNTPNEPLWLSLLGSIMVVLVFLVSLILL